MDNSKNLIFLFFVIFTANTIKAQDTKLNIFESFLRIHKIEDTAKVNIFNKIVHIHYDKYIKITKNCVTHANEISEEEKDLLGIAKSEVYRKLNSCEKALHGHKMALKIGKELNSKPQTANFNIEFGIIFSAPGNYSLSLEYFQKYRKLEGEDATDKMSEINEINNIGNIYLFLANYPKAFHYSRKALKIAEELNDKRTIATCYAYMGYLHKKMHNVKSLEYFSKAPTSEVMGDKLLTINLLVFLRYINVLQIDFARTLQSYQKAIKLSEETGMKRKVSELLNKIGDIYLKQKKYYIVSSATMKGLQLANKLKLMNSKNNSYKQLSKIYAATQEYKKVYLNYKLLIVVYDSVNNEKRTPKIERLQYSYKCKSLSQNIELEHQKKVAVHKNIAILYILGCFLLSFLTLYLYRSLRIKRKVSSILNKEKHHIEVSNEEYLVINEELLRFDNEFLGAKNLTKEKTNLLLQVADSLPVFISLIKHDLNYIAVNKGYASIFDKQKYEIEGRNIKEILNSDTFEKAYPYIVKALKGEMVTYENIILQKEGTKLILETTYVPYYLHNKVQGFISCSTDITERKRTEKILKESEEIKAQLLNDEIGQINRELDSNQRVLTSATLKLIQNSERDAQTINQLMEIGKYTTPESEQKINALIANIRAVSASSNWTEFEILFEKINDSFYKNLNTQFPTLSTNERKMCAFLKLNMSNKDIARITFQSDDALKKARVRLRKKLEISKEIRLSAYLQNI